jgi:SAM-dependent methyltransferase
MSKADRQTQRERSRRERQHFREVVARGEELYWADRTAAGRRRQELRAARLQGAADLEDRAGARVLDIGCGTGCYTRPFARRTRASVVGLDVTVSLLRKARRASPSNSRFAAGDASELPFPAESFDAVVGNAVLHHLPLELSVPELIRVLKPGGRFCFAEPNLLNPHVFLERNIPWLRRWLESSPDEVAFVRWRLRSALEAFGLVDLSIEPFDFLYPLTPRPLVRAVEAAGRVLERIPGVREIAGSLLILARKPDKTRSGEA